MDYSDTIEWLFSQIPTFQNVGADAYKPGLEGIQTLSDAFNNPHKSLKAIHIGGTNGKGSTSSLIASILQENGLRVGLFTSPHLVDFRERIRINGEMISKDAVTDFIKRFRDLKLDYKPSFFELTTIMAFEWFERNNVDVAVIEVGLGGRLDSTNILTPILSVITNISLDHTALLGNTREAIAREKAGIIKPNIPVIIGNAEGSVRELFQETADKFHAPITFCNDSCRFDKVVKHTDEIEYFTREWGNIKCPLAGDCQIENTNTVLHALEPIGKVFNLSPENIKSGFKNILLNTGLTGRWTTIHNSPKVICDTGHNPGGWEYLGPKLHEISSTSNLHLVLGFVNDKDISAILRQLPLKATFRFATPSVKRGRDASEVLEMARRHGIEGVAFNSVTEAVRDALDAALPEDVIFVGGSTFVVADLLSSAKFVFKNVKQALP